MSMSSLFGKKLEGTQRVRSSRMWSAACVDEIRAQPWQTDTCIGNWHYDRRLYENERLQERRSKSCSGSPDVVSKNGNLLLNMPVRGDGTIDEKEEAIVDQIAAWTQRKWRGDLRHPAVAQVRRGTDQRPPAGHAE